jgi:hypothetical protein
MQIAQDCECWLKLMACIVVAGGLFAGTTHAQYNGDRMSTAPADKWDKKSPVREDLHTGGTSKATPEPYGGQIYCPVTGGKLGLAQPAIPVQTTIGATNPGAIARLFGKKATPGAVIFVCCPMCADAVRQNPERYLGMVISDMASLSTTMHYANAPPKKPEQGNADSVIQPAAYRP